MVFDWLQVQERDEYFLGKQAGKSATKQASPFSAINRSASLSNEPAIESLIFVEIQVRVLFLSGLVYKDDLRKKLRQLQIDSFGEKGTEIEYPVVHVVHGMSKVPWNEDIL